MQGKHLLGDRLVVEVRASVPLLAGEAGQRIYDLLVLSGMSVDEQQQTAAQFQEHRRWRLVPVLYLVDPSSRGLAVPGSYRPEMDGLVQGALGSPLVERRIRTLAREGTAGAELIVAGPFELDPVRARLRHRELEIALTEREAHILAILLTHPNRTVGADEIIARSWGAEADPRYLQILRRHVSNIRRKLNETPARRAVRTVRGSGYRFDTRAAS
jgi:two-component system KDP operon response regulator KdpE